jgi:DNA-directed RNA polymerase subunit beta'
MIDKNIAVSYKVTIDSNTYTVRAGVDTKFIYSEDLDAPIKYFPLNTIFINNRTSNPESFIVGVLTVDLNTNDIKFDGISTNNRFGSSNREVAIAEKKTMIAQAIETVDEIKGNYNMGLITDTERYNQVIDVWTNTNAALTEMIMSRMKSDQGGFNSVYMMLDSGARGSKEQIRQLSGMRGLMAKPQKAGAVGAEIIENPIIANFKEGLSILEYFISTHGARKGLADTALKTADAGYLTRRLVDVAQDVIITEDDCGTLRGTEVAALKKNDEIVEKLSERILGRVSLHDIYNPENDEILVHADELINEELAKKVEEAGIETVEVRSPLTCEAKKGICAKCYGRNLATGKMIHMGEAVGVIAAQSIGEPGTQLTLRTFHQGGTAGNVSENPTIVAKRDGIVEFDELRTIISEDENGNEADIVISRSTEFRLVADNAARTPLMVANVPYGSALSVKPGDKVKKGDLLFSLYHLVLQKVQNHKVRLLPLMEFSLHYLLLNGIL